MSFVPRFYAYPTPDKTPFESAVQGVFGGMDAMSKLKSAQSDIDVNKQNIAASQQSMEQSKQKFPLDLEKARVDIAKIRDDMSLTPYQQKLYIAQIANQYADAAKSKAETSKIGKEITQGPEPLSPIGKVIRDYTNTTDPEHKKILENAMQKMSSSDEFAPVTELDKLKTKSFNTDLESVNAAAEHAGNVINDLKDFQNHASKIPATSKGIYNKATMGLSQYAPYLPIIGNNESAAATDAANAATARLVAHQVEMFKNQKGLTQGAVQLVQKQKPSLSQTSEGAKLASDAIMASSLSVIENAKLYNTIANSNIPDHKKAQAVKDIWEESQRKYPIFDEEGKINLNNASKWQDILKKKFGGEARSNYVPSQADLELAAKKYNMTVDEAKRKLGVQ
jgi:hypothetical protein